MTLYDDALLFATLAHEGVVDKGGAPYIEHPKAVAAMVTGEIPKAAALLHDVLEDTDISAKDLLACGFSEEVVDIVLILTRIPGETYFDYIDRIKFASNMDALVIKIADVLHNLSRPYPGDEGMKKRYAKTLKKLKGEI